MSKDVRLSTFLTILQRLGRPPVPGIRMLDFGCGQGGLVAAALKRGLDAYGCDIAFENDPANQASLAQLRASERVRDIEVASAASAASPESKRPYRLPFDDESFDAVISDQVFEHVFNYPEAIAELWRVMKPGGAFLHMFPSRYQPIEAHIFVPFAPLIRHRWWLQLWAAAGLRNPFQRGLSASATVEANERFLRTMVNYLPRRELARHFSQGFECEFVEREFMRLSKAAKVFIWPRLYSALRGRVVFGVKLPKTAGVPVPAATGASLSRAAKLN